MNSVNIADEDPSRKHKGLLARIFYELLAATLDMGILLAVLGYRLLRRTIQVRLGPNTLRLPSGTPIFMLSRHQVIKHPG
jgi:hypothetical protein